MKFTKRLAAIAACACMATTSMVGMSASAGFSSTLLEPNGNPVYLTINGTKYGFQIMSEISTKTSGGKISGTAKTSVYEVGGQSIPKNNVYINTFIYGKDKNNNIVTLDGSSKVLSNPNSESSLYATVSSRSFDDYSAYAAAGYANISYGNIGEVKTISSGQTAFVS